MTCHERRRIEVSLFAGRQKAPTRPAVSRFEIVVGDVVGVGTSIRAVLDGTANGLDETTAAPSKEDARVSG